MIPALLYISLALLVGYIGRERKFKFWGNFLITLILTPLVGVIAILAQDVHYGNAEAEAPEADKSAA